MLHVNDNVRVFLALVLSSTAIACGGPSTPSDEEARKAFLENSQVQWEYLGDGVAELSGFRKANGIRHENGLYAYEFEAALTCLKPWDFGTASAVKPSKCQPGEKVTVTGTLTFQQTENGWRRFGQGL